ncbi:hypothetical protein DSUL_20305 [Desulfovibrionales bacterium]
MTISIALRKKNDICLRIRIGGLAVLRTDLINLSFYILTAKIKAGSNKVIDLNPGLAAMVFFVRRDLLLI